MAEINEERKLTDKERVLFTHPVVLASMDNPPVKLVDGKTNQFVCPYCGNGTGSSHTGVDVSRLAAGYKYYCFKCHERFDNLDIIALHHGLDVKANLGEVINQALKDIESVKPDAIPAYADVEVAPKVTKDYIRFIKNANSRLKDFVKDSWRGLSFETLNNCLCGYAPSFGTPQTPRFIVPWTRNHFMARFVGDFDDYSDSEKDEIHEKQHCGAKGKPFLYDAVADSIKRQAKEKDITAENMCYASFNPIFIVEGEFDAMTLRQLGYEVMALGGSDLPDKMFERFKNLFDGVPFIFIVMLDNDDTGYKSSIAVAEKICTLNNKVAIPLGLGTIENGAYKPLTDSEGNILKDANDALQRNSEGLSAVLKTNFETAHALALHLDEGGNLGNFAETYKSFIDAFNRVVHDYDKPENVIKAAEYFTDTKTLTKVRVKQFRLVLSI